MEKPTPETHFELEPSFDEKGNLIFKKKSEIEKGKKSKSSGLVFESRVRADLEEKGWIVDKWSNNVDLQQKKIVGAKKNWKFNPFRKIMMPAAQGTGFPDFIGIQSLGKDKHNIIGIEVKTNGYLSREEKEKCKFYLEGNVFSKILVAKKVKIKNKIRIEYTDVNKLLEKMRS